MVGTAPRYSNGDVVGLPEAVPVIGGTNEEVAH
jgi:hypothetical protein